MRYVTETNDTLPGFTHAAATFSEDRKYRFTLDRTWDADRPRALVIMLNPSTAGAHKGDPTVGRVVGFCKTYGMGAVRVLNLYGLIATQPKHLWESPDPVGEGYDELIAADLYAMNELGGLTIVAWGTHAKSERVEWFERQAYGQWCLGVNQDGSPKHPLYLSSATALSAWPVE